MDPTYEFDSPLTLENALSLAKKLIQSDFSDVQTLVLRGAWQGKSYRQIADEAQYDGDYLKQVGSRLWRSLSLALGQEISKQNLRRALIEYYRSTPESFQLSGNLSETRWVGREQLVQDLCHLLMDDCRIINIVGITGIGKSSLAMRLTLEPQIRQKWPTVCVVRCDRQDNTFEQMARTILGGTHQSNTAVQKSEQYWLYMVLL